MIHYGCPKCQALMASPDGSIGQSETCPQCGNVTIVPQPAVSHPRGVIPGASRQPAETQTAKEKESATIRTIAGVIAGVIVVAVLVGIAMWYRSCMRLLDSL